MTPQRNNAGGYDFMLFIEGSMCIPCELCHGTRE